MLRSVQCHSEQTSSNQASGPKTRGHFTLLSDQEGLWRKSDLVFVPDEIRGNWQRKAEISPKSDRRKKAALTELIEILKEGKSRKIRVLHNDAESWMER